jgi:AraC family transcriptional regulator
MLKPECSEREQRIMKPDSVSVGGNNMDCRIVQKPAFDIVGKSRKFPEAGEESLAEIPRFWDEFMNSKNGGKVLVGLTENILSHTVTGSQSLGISMCRAGAEEFTYAIGMEARVGTDIKDFEIIHVPATRWAIFDSIGPMPDAIQEVTRRIFSEWFPATGYAHPEYELEVYLPGDPGSKNYHCQVWIHVNEKL